MRKSMTAMAAVFVFTACDGNPFLTEQAATETPTTTTTTTTNTTTGTTTTTDTTTGITGGTTLPPGTASPTATNTIVRYEPTDAVGGGFATSFAYDAATDTFTVDNLPFDGTAAYSRAAGLSSLGPYAVYENAAPVTDPQSGATVPQFEHKALYGVSTSGRTQFAIVRTGDYIEFGFGGFIYQRNGEVVLPTSGQATYSGVYSAVQDYNGTEGIQFVQGDMNMYIDFDDFNTSAGVRGEITNRRIFDSAGNDLTNARINEINLQNNANISNLPVLRFLVADGAADANGEIQGTVRSFINNLQNNRVQLEQGNFYAILAGPNAEEVVGIVVSTYAVNPTATARDTGGFILYR